MNRAKAKRAACETFARIFAALALCASLAWGAIAAARDVPDNAFVRTRGVQFVLGDKEFRVAGYNNHYLTMGTAEEVIRVLDDAVAMRANVVRTFIRPIIGSLDGTMPTIWDWKSKRETSNLGVNGVYIAYWDSKRNDVAVNSGKNGLRRVDFLLREAAKRKLRLIIALSDFWAYTGGAQQIAAWYGGTIPSHDFAASRQARDAYKKIVKVILTRKNALTGVRYSDDPTVFAWELLNEPHIKPRSLLRDWLHEMAPFVKSLAPRQLLASGHGSIDTRLFELEMTDIDFGTWHGYASYLDISADEFGRLITEYCEIGASFGKPVLLEEFALPRTRADRAEIYAKWLGSIEQDHRCAGWLVWRLVSRQASGTLPEDEHDKFDIYNDDSPVSRVLRSAAIALTQAKPRLQRQGLAR